MRILFDSKKLSYKNPFGTLTPLQNCQLHIHIPASVKTTAVECVFLKENGEEFYTVQLHFQEQADAYDIWQGEFHFAEAGLYFYYFRITGHTGTFRLFKQGNDTNMEAGDLWQVSCIPQDFTTPHWAKGGVIYQVFPDRFHKAGSCDLSGKLTPYTIHDDWSEEVFWQPDEQGNILNNDFYGGNFQGIQEKLPYLASLGVSILYLNPISKSFSNHRYDTGDYKTPDPMLGTTEDFTALCEAAHKLNIRIILDGVFSHTGSNSLYFDRERQFGGKGAACSKDSEFYPWYTFYEYPNSYRCWWDFDTLPTVNKLEPSFINYIISGEDSVIAHWLRLGADGFRLDVADELPDSFLSLLKQRVRAIKPDGLVIGEVWEDASNKIAYDVRRTYFTEGTLDSVMNYPFRTAILKLLRGEDDGQAFETAVMTVAENYPPQVLACCMNLLGSHDTPRILTALVDNFDGPREALAQRFLSPEDYALAKQRLFIASLLQYTLPGAPCLYYGDEAGMSGGKDPFNRRSYPWGQEDAQLKSHYQQLGQLKKQYPALRYGALTFLYAEGHRICFARTFENRILKIYVNLSPEPWEIAVKAPVFQHRFSQNGAYLEPMGFCITEE